MARVLCRGVFDAEDIAQEVYCVAARRIEAFDSTTSRPTLIEAMRVAEGILASIPAKKREAFVLAEFEGLSCAAIARVVGAKEQTVWSRLHYARREFDSKIDAWRRHRPLEPGRHLCGSTCW